MHSRQITVEVYGPAATLIHLTCKLTATSLSS